MREIRLSGSAGGETSLTGLPYPDPGLNASALARVDSVPRPWKGRGTHVRFPRESRQDSSLTYMESAIRSNGGRTRQAMASTAWWSYGTTERRCQEHREKRSATWLAQQHLKGPLCGPFG